MGAYRGNQYPYARNTGVMFKYRIRLREKGETPFVKHPSEETKWILRNLYYRQNEFARDLRTLCR